MTEKEKTRRQPKKIKRKRREEKIKNIIYLQYILLNPTGQGYTLHIRGRLVLWGCFFYILLTWSD